MADNQEEPTPMAEQGSDGPAPKKPRRMRISDVLLAVALIGLPIPVVVISANHPVAGIGPMGVAIIYFIWLNVASGFVVARGYRYLDMQYCTPERDRSMALRPSGAGGVQGRNERALSVDLALPAAATSLPSWRQGLRGISLLPRRSPDRQNLPGADGSRQGAESPPLDIGY